MDLDMLVLIGVIVLVAPIAGTVFALLLGVLTAGRHRRAALQGKPQARGFLDSVEARLSAAAQLFGYTLQAASPEVRSHDTKAARSRTPANRRRGERRAGDRRRRPRPVAADRRRRERRLRPRPPQHTPGMSASMG